MFSDVYIMLVKPRSKLPVVTKSFLAGYVMMKQRIILLFGKLIHACSSVWTMTKPWMMLLIGTRRKTCYVCCATPFNHLPRCVANVIQRWLGITAINASFGMIGQINPYFIAMNVAFVVQGIPRITFIVQHAMYVWPLAWRTIINVSSAVLKVIVPFVENICLQAELLLPFW